KRHFNDMLDIACDESLTMQKFRMKLVREEFEQVAQISKKSKVQDTVKASRKDETTPYSGICEQVDTQMQCNIQEQDNVYEQDDIQNQEDIELIDALGNNDYTVVDINIRNFDPVQKKS
ncbi:3057_t:CDS:2, partial [Paraglomus occultum]